MPCLIDFDLRALPVLDEAWKAFLADKGNTLDAFHFMTTDVEAVQTDAGGPWNNLFSNQPPPSISSDGGRQAFEDVKKVVWKALAAQSTPTGADIRPLPKQPIWTMVANRHIVHSPVLDGEKALYVRRITVTASSGDHDLSYEVVVCARYTGLEEPKP